ncbi:MAG TPA: HAMP domain-containing histidine kinase [Candidatus Eubacterium faecavium]|nr:HAMP domain-containing histidine kinase [Candidatus Eubacterium faecavium]
MAAKADFGKKIENRILKLARFLHIKPNIFTKYFLTFAAIFLTVLVVLGISLVLLVNNYTVKTRTDLLEENVLSIANTIDGTLTTSEMNNRYTLEKELLCETLATVSQSIDADVFVCDTEGNIILCRDKAGTLPDFGMFAECSVHGKIVIGSNLLAAVYQQGQIVEKAIVSGTQCFVVGRPVYQDGNIIGSVFALSNTGIQNISITVLRLFLISAFFCLIFAFICIYYLTKRMFTPLQQMSKAAKQFAAGDFSYRVKVEGEDELADLGHAFNDMADALNVLEGSRRSFVSNVSHELKTPMTSISGFIDGILDGTIPKEKQDYYLGIVSGEVKRLSRLVVSMLNMSKIESGDLEMKPSNYDISDQIIHILLTFEQKIENKNIDIRGLDEFKPTYIVADPDMIYQAIYNLVDNAVKFTNEGGYIEVRLKDSDTQIELSIKNSGTGIKAEDLSRVFERFYKADKSRSLDAKGAGLGLYLVKLMIEMHGGRVSAKSESEDTAEFSFTLPKQFSPVYLKETR